MSFKIGFHAENESNQLEQAQIAVEKETKITEPKRSVVEVYFPHRDRSWSYYNDRFDLHEGDNVYVDGKLEGYRGVVVDVNYNFKIDLSIYKKVIAVVDTGIKGELNFADEMLLSFAEGVMDYQKILLWYKAPKASEAEIVSGSDDRAFSLDDTSSWEFGHGNMERGYDYYHSGKVVFLEVNKGIGRAIVTCSDTYQVEFKLNGYDISALTCDCFCNGGCKHEAAVLFQLKALLENIEKYDQASGYFAALAAKDFYSFTMRNKKHGKIAIE